MKAFPGVCSAGPVQNILETNITRLPPTPLLCAQCVDSGSDSRKGCDIHAFNVITNPAPSTLGSDGTSAIPMESANCSTTGTILLWPLPSTAILVHMHFTSCTKTGQNVCCAWSTLAITKNSVKGASWWHLQSRQRCSTLNQAGSFQEAYTK